MSERRRLLVALVVPRPIADELNGLRRALGDRDLDRIPPHITLVPPVNVAAEDLAAVHDLVDGAAARTGPLALRLGPPASFAPSRPVLYLAVFGDLEGLGALQQALNQSPLGAPASRPERAYVPHVTIRANTPEALLLPSQAVLGGYEADVVIERIDVFEQDPTRRWHPLYDVALGRRAVVGTGGRALSFALSERLSLEARDLLSKLTVGGDEHGAIDEPVALTAHLFDELVGASSARVVGDALEILAVATSPSHRREGVARLMLGAFEKFAAERGLSALVALAPNDAIVRALFFGVGYEEVLSVSGPSLLVRVLRGQPSDERVRRPR